MLRVMEAMTSTRNAILAPVVLGASVVAGLATSDPQVFQGALALGGLAWAISVLSTASSPRPGEPEDVFAARGRILNDVRAGLDGAAQRLIDRADQVARRGRSFRPSLESGYDPAEWEARAGQLARIYELADRVERVYGGPNAEPGDATAMLALPEVPRQVEQAVRLSRRRVDVLQSLYSTNTDEIASRLQREEAEAQEADTSDQLRRVRDGRAEITRRELETYRHLQEERETIDALLDSIESFLRRLSFRTISTEEVQDQIAEIDTSLQSHDSAMVELKEELRRASGGE